MNRLILLLAVLWLFTAPGCTGGKQQYYEESGSVFNTLYRIKYKSDHLLTEKIDREFCTFNLSLNPFNPNSIIARVNNNQPVEVDSFFTTVFNKAREVSERTDGMFDITCAPLVNLWGFGFNKMDSVRPYMVDSLREFVGYRKVWLEGKEVNKADPRVMLNCSAIAKGYACDVIASLLEREGITDYMVEIGGEIVASGVNPGGQCWQLGINKPHDDPAGLSDEIQEVIRFCSKAGLATSGDYRNYYLKEGKKYAHTIDPRTGYPAAQNILSATVVAPDCMTADAYATAFMAMGLERACEVAATIPGIEYYFIYGDDEGEIQVRFSEGMQAYLVQ
ncbi:MAG: FAD:protein FMN transferase [Tannerellaceae bacterium]|nr:FAD:protein FMN transferase [Tannerellaceae bacterium]MCD8264247.1 FAD:protein FMN transferase [Tannerellaceae bacterium]